LSATDWQLKHKKKAVTYKTVFRLLVKGYTKGPATLTEEEQDILFWFCKNCVATVQCKWGPVAIGKEKSVKAAIAGTDLFFSNCTHSDIGYALAGQKYHTRKWADPTKKPKKSGKDKNHDNNESGSEDDEEVELRDST
jgi:hypothetical protein